MSIGGTINKVEELASTLQVAFDAGAKRILIPMSSAADIPTVPADLFRPNDCLIREDYNALLVVQK